MKALLWKDYRINRSLLAFAALLVAGPFFAVRVINRYPQFSYHHHLRPRPYALVNTGTFSLAFHLVTIAMLGGVAVAAERADRSAEFLAYLPPSRRAIITSKAILAVSAMLLICAVEVAVMYGLAPRIGPIPEGLVDFRDKLTPVLIPTAVLIFGAAWLGSSLLTSHSFATGVGVAAPIALVGVLAAVAYFLDLRGFFDLGAWYKLLCIPLGVLCFAAGVVYYLHRVEP